MKTTSTLPPPDEILARIRACQEEIKALKRLLRAAQAAAAADTARDKRREARP